MGDNYEEALLKKYEEELEYYEDCPGCKVEQLKRSDTSVPVKPVFFISMVTLCASLPISSLFPFLYFMVRDFHIAEREEDISYYAGYVGSSFMLGRALTSILWGIIADRYGRKPVVVIGTITVVIFNALFGLSTNFWMAIVTRFLIGSLCGIIGTMRAYASEICRKEYHALGISAVSCLSPSGKHIMGDRLGNWSCYRRLSCTACRKISQHIFQRILFWEIPIFFTLSYDISLCINCNSNVLLGFETLHKHNKIKKDKSNFHDAAEGTPDESNGLNVSQNMKHSEGRAPSSQKSLLKNWPLVSSIISSTVCIPAPRYCLFGSIYLSFKSHFNRKLKSKEPSGDMSLSLNKLFNISYGRVLFQIFSLWAVSPGPLGVSSFTTADVGQVRLPSQALVCYSALLVYPLVERITGPVMISSFLSIPLLASYPYIALLTGFGLSIALNCASVLKNILSVSITTGLLIMQNKNMSQARAANGISMSTMSLFKTIGPAAGAHCKVKIMFHHALTICNLCRLSWSNGVKMLIFCQKRQLVFFVLNVMRIFRPTSNHFRPFLQEPEDSDIPKSKTTNSFGSRKWNTREAHVKGITLKYQNYKCR
ncbi:hypothetical protein HAX54_014074 [Datura stramonium]|uniref:Major facilitator superfamily (MFS) profile domain-containing protein n=1 Tax=Datura stramonium TaxID=4076 RepID=A0ABS8TQ51_DATST|nr:hypothetical protein [Datura stramonium]